MTSLRPYPTLRSYAKRMERLIERDPDPEQAMELIVTEADKIGLIKDTSVVRYTNPAIFVQDLLLDNTVVGDWCNMRSETIKSPLNIDDIQSLLDSIRYR